MSLIYENITFTGATASAVVTVAKAHAVNAVVSVGQVAPGYVLTGAPVAGTPQAITISIFEVSTTSATLIPNATATGTVTAVVLYDGY